jgi:beta-lactamase class A
LTQGYHFDEYADQLRHYQGEDEAETVRRFPFDATVSGAIPARYPPYIQALRLSEGSRRGSGPFMVNRYLELSRRGFIGGLGAVAVSCASAVKPSRIGSNDSRVQLAELERRSGGRLGVYAFRYGSPPLLAYRESERFATCSTFKWVLAAAILTRVDRRELSLTQEVPFVKADILDYAPVAKQHAERGNMTVRELAEAAVTVSDNTAANLLLNLVGGPSGLTRVIRDHGDTITRLDRTEVELNSNLPEDPRDTTSPQAMAELVCAVLTTDALSATSRNLLLGWMVACRTGTQRLRAGLPASWRVGDKTGSTNDRGVNGRAATNDVAIAWPPSGPPIFIAVYLSESLASADLQNGIHAEVGRLVAEKVGANLGR